MNADEVRAANKSLQNTLENLIVAFMKDTGHVPEVSVYMSEHKTLGGTTYVPEMTVTSYVK